MFKVVLMISQDAILRRNDQPMESMSEDFDRLHRIVP
jgi:hypothetical protein